jgi:S-adenosylmethionine:tRNA ribosyltransferase-isomerase
MKNLSLETFNFELPENLIAQEPLKNREEANLLYINGEHLDDKKISNLADILTSGDVLVFNNTKVIPARLIGKKGLATINLTLHYRINNQTWLAFAKNSKRLCAGDEIVFADDFSAKVLEKNQGGEVKICFTQTDVFNLLEKYGFLPLPPYIKRENINTKEDKTNYQSVFAKVEGAVAAPTASLHFTENLLEKLKQKGVEMVFVTLHVGAGTFLPVKVDNVYEHKMHKEYGEISKEVAQTINQAKAAGKNIVAVGTTAMRVLEFVAKENDGNLKQFSGEIDLFILPGFKFNIVDKLLTNFHLPKSTLFMLVCAFAGLNNMQKAYAHAIAKQYRFFSYGDCCFLEKL